MNTFALNQTTNDMEIDANGNWNVFTNRIQSIAQIITCYLQTFLGEIPTNLDLGVDYFGIIFNEFLPQQSKLNEFVSVILTAEGVTGISNFSIAPNPVEGKIGYDFTITTDVGNIQFQDLLNNGNA
jgi:hypothetical protein